MLQSIFYRNFYNIKISDLKTFWKPRFFQQQVGQQQVVSAGACKLHIGRAILRSTTNYVYLKDFMQSQKLWNIQSLFTCRVDQNQMFSSLIGVDKNEMKVLVIFILLCQYNNITISTLQHDYLDGRYHMDTQNQTFQTSINFYSSVNASQVPVITDLSSMSRNTALRTSSFIKKLTSS
ncbi:Hypothetical_protein [Hexamita inflata]|uniref:Hypothetical_protein n=1 Tax=Hexamita inflata TaxID=28002 RepID=A0AA86QKW6_9EUKA|nr:Hypothetical protein HINF_LOCUS41260 [Hexamita inflata]